MSFKVPLFKTHKVSCHNLAGDGGAHNSAEAYPTIQVSVCWLVLHGMQTTTLVLTEHSSTYHWARKPNPALIRSTQIGPGKFL